MRILRNLVLLAIPLLIMINLYRFVATPSGAVFEYRGFVYMKDYFSTFTGLSNTMDTISQISTSLSGVEYSFNNIDSLESFFVAIGQFFKLVGLFFSVPISITIDLVMDIWWVINIFMF